MHLEEAVAATAVAVMAVAAKAVATAVAVMAVAAKVINQFKIDLLELKVGKIAVMEMLLKMQVALIKVVVEEEEVLRLKGVTTLLQIMEAQNLKDSLFLLMPSIFKLLGNFF